MSLQTKAYKGKSKRKQLLVKTQIYFQKKKKKKTKKSRVLNS